MCGDTGFQRDALPRLSFLRALAAWASPIMNLREQDKGYPIQAFASGNSASTEPAKSAEPYRFLARPNASCAASRHF